MTVPTVTGWPPACTDAVNVAICCAAMEFDGVTVRVVVVAVAALAGGAKKPQNNKADKNTTKSKERFVLRFDEKKSACTIWGSLSYSTLEKTIEGSTTCYRGELNTSQALIYLHLTSPNRYTTVSVESKTAKGAGPFPDFDFACESAVWGIQDGWDLYGRSGLRRGVWRGLWRWARGWWRCCRLSLS